LSQGNQAFGHCMLGDRWR